ncbi:MAG: fumarylacetoacetate hydrolase family protein [Abditibacteriota bacterium]|nr:fumarylacetoacetate hydrolase family protein [Abditibacteriota bacterium]
MRFYRFKTAKYPEGTYGVSASGGKIEVVKGGLFDPVEKTGDTVETSEIESYLPLTTPPNIVAVGMNYKDHAAELGLPLPKSPLIFLKSTAAMNAHMGNILIPGNYPDGNDYEAELCVIIGKAAKNVSESEAPEYIFGYACGNDVTNRQAISEDGQWARGKSFDTFAPIGPFIETEYDSRGKRIVSRYNGEIMQDDNTDGMVFDIPYLVSYISRQMTLLPGTVIMTGTPFGVGYWRDPRVQLRPGDLCEVEIEGLGCLRNTVIGN